MTEELKQRALDLYKPPFRQRFLGIIDANGALIAAINPEPCLRTEVAEANKIAEMIAEALTQYWTAALTLRGGIYKCNKHGGYGFVQDCIECQPATIDKGEV